VAHIVMPDALETVAAILFFFNYALSATAVAFCVVLYRLQRQIGWLILGVAFLWPFGALLLRIVHRLPLLTYRSIGTDHYGVAQLTYNWRFPGFYLVAVVALVLLIRDARRGKKD
jgi:hypothetical protein